MSKHKTRQIIRITEATMQVIEENGLSRVSIASIAKQAGITRQTIYNYFDDVEGIIASALSEHSHAVTRTLLAEMGKYDDPFERIHALAKLQISMASIEHENIALDAALSPELRADVAEHMNPVKVALECALLAGIDSGAFSAKLHPKSVCDLVWGIIEAAANAAVAHPDQKPNILDAVSRAIQVVLQH